MNQRGTLYLVCDLNYTFAGEGKYVVALSSFRKDFVVNKVQNYGSLLSVLFDIFLSLILFFSLSQEAMMILVLECGSRWIDRRGRIFADGVAYTEIESNCSHSWQCSHLCSKSEPLN
jgi:hypothetical protein